MRHARPDREPYRVLELGFGAGANIPFLLSLGVEYFGTEGSATAVDRAKERFADSRSHFACCDFTQEYPFDGPFDLVVDRSSLTHNGTQAIRHCIDRLQVLMRPGGKFIGIDWFSTEHSDFSIGIEEEDHFTRVGFPSGQFCDVGRVHFSDEAHLLDLFADFKFLRMEHKLLEEHVPATGRRFASFNFVCELNI
jgi:cyclopropane fatty-acyl-phospholipid synthase-like methyltransferase